MADAANELRPADDRPVTKTECLAAADLDKPRSVAVCRSAPRHRPRARPCWNRCWRWPRPNPRPAPPETVGTMRVVKDVPRDLMPWSMPPRPSTSVFGSRRRDGSGQQLEATLIVRNLVDNAIRLRHRLADVSTS